VKGGIEESKFLAKDRLQTFKSLIIASLRVRRNYRHHWGFIVRPFRAKTGLVHYLAR